MKKDAVNKKDTNSNAIANVIANTKIQASLKVGQPNDKYEQEADQVANKVMSMPNPAISTKQTEEEELQTKPLYSQISAIQKKQEEEEPVQTKLIQKQTNEEEEPIQSNTLQKQDDEEEPVQTKYIQQQVNDEEDNIQSKQIMKQTDEEEEPIQKKILNKKDSNNNSQQVSPWIQNKINSTKDSGAPLPPDARSFMENRFGTDFSGVKIHNDTDSVKMNKDMHSQAFTVGNNIYFNSDRYNPGSSSGKQLLAHELTHTIQQNGSEKNNIQNQVQRKQTVTIGKGRKKITAMIGEIEFSGKALTDIMKNGGLLPGEDQAHLVFYGNKLGYDINHLNPADPFRWSKIIDLIDSDEKVYIEKVGFLDNFKTRYITAKGPITIDSNLMTGSAEGMTLITESKYKSIYPKEQEFVCSSASDKHYIYYTTDIASSAATSAIAHEMLGHLWLAIKGVPWVHPKKKQDIIRTGTLSDKHGIKDPLGNTYTGTVEDFIRDYVSSKSFGILKSPTQYVSPKHLTDALSKFKTEFVQKSTGKLNNAWNVPKDPDFQYLIISNNYRFASDKTASKQATAGKTAGITKDSIIKNISSWYSSLNPDKQYIFYQFADAVIKEILRPSELSYDLLKVIKKPTDMK